jgi:serine/threonine protein kinase
MNMKPKMGFNLIFCNSFYVFCSINGGELFERVVADDFTLTERDCVLFMRQICEGVKYLHEKSIVHLDLKVNKINYKIVGNMTMTDKQQNVVKILAREYFMLR